MNTKSTFRKNANDFLTHTKQEKGITLIVLVITIIVLIILAGVSIQMITGQNGLLNQASTAKEKAGRENIVEEAQTDLINQMKREQSEVTENILKKVLKKYFINVPDSLPDDLSTVVLTSNDGKYNDILASEIYDGNFSDSAPTSTKKTTIEQAKDSGTPFKEKTTVEDKYGNNIVVPEDFKIADDSALDVTGGVVIEDASTDAEGNPTATAGSQFVWIPVGEIYTDIYKTKDLVEKIILGRYDFEEDGTPKEKGKNVTSNHESENTDVFNAFTSEIEDGKTKVEKTGGYYIGRYEARTATPLNAETDNDNDLPPLTVKANESIYNYVTQPQASKLSKKMYENKNFKSDLMNGCAWDTAIVFLQIFDDRKNSQLLPYSKQTSLIRSFASKGTNNLTQENNQDKICNIWDMASNCYEWTTAGYRYTNDVFECRGGSTSYFTSFKYFRLGDENDQKTSFRVVLVL